MGSAGILGNVAANRAGTLAGRIGRIEVAAALHGERDIQVHHAGLNHHPLVFQIHFQDAIHPGKGDHQSALARNGAAGKPRTRAPPHERHAEFLRQFDQR